MGVGPGFDAGPITSPDAGILSSCFGRGTGVSFFAREARLGVPCRDGADL